MGWRSVVVTQPAYLSLKHNQFCISLSNEQQTAHIPVEDISALVLDNPQITVSQPLLCTLAEEGIAVLVVDKQHLPSGIFMPYLQYHRGLRRLRAQLALSRPVTKRWHQQIVRQKIINQTETLRRCHHSIAVKQLDRLAGKVRSGDPDNCEAQAARAYFSSLLKHTTLKRREDSLFNAALNYGYAIIRACIARQVSGSGLHPAIGLFHHNEQNAFNLADDLIEPYRPLFDHWVYRHFAKEPKRSLTSKDKALLVRFLGEDIGNNQNTDTGTVLANIEMAVQNFAVACESPKNKMLWLAAHSSRQVRFELTDYHE